MNQVQLSDAVYVAGVEVVGQLDKAVVPDRLGAAQALAAALERRSVPVTVTVDGELADGPVVLGAGRSDGVVVAVAGDDTALEMGNLLHRHHWHRIHLVTFARQGVGFKTISA